MHRIKNSISLAALFLVALFVSTDRLRANETRITQSVLLRHLDAFKRGDIEGVLFGCADDEIIIVEGVALRGRDEIRPVFEDYHAEFSSTEPKGETRHLQFTGRIGYVAWSAETPAHV
ncbi:hypothetical protein [Albidovulum aquaemixtae]|nr:hypothetical protein [Defluviimonas aquaemixtae]